MHRYIARLINTGMPRKIAVYMCKYFSSRSDLERYVEGVEAECLVQMEAV